jgi:hypothetical protein
MKVSLLEFQSFWPVRTLVNQNAGSLEVDHKICPIDNINTTGVPVISYIKVVCKSARVFLTRLRLAKVAERSDPIG